MAWLRIARTALIENLRLVRLDILMVLTVISIHAITAPISHAAVSVQWNDVPSLGQDVTPNGSIFVMPGSFTVISEASCYDVSASVFPRLDGTATSWNRPGTTVVMDSDNFVVASGTDYAAAFDLRAADRDDVWRPYQTGGTDVVILASMPKTPPSGTLHAIQIALVLAESGESSGMIYHAGKRRFVELPAKSYDFSLSLTVTESSC